MEDDYVQLVGATCPVCSERIGTAREARPCATCKTPVHRKCAAAHACAPRPAATPPAAPATKRRNFLPYVGATIGVMVAATLSPMINHWRELSFIRERAARDLRCSVDDVTVDVRDDEIHASGCHDHVSYLVGCRPITRDECLVAENMSDHEVNDLIDERLHLR